MHVIGNHKVNITIPLNLALFEHLHRGNTGKYCEPDCNHLAGALCRQTIRTYNDLVAVHTEPWLPIMTYAVWPHKKKQYTHDGMEFLVEQCRSDRPAFVGKDGSGGEEEGAPLLYMYNAMGLHRQHPDQVCILARCGNYMVAAALITRCCHKLLLNYRPDRVKFWTDAPGTARDEWLTRSVQAGLTAGPHRIRLSESFPKDMPAEKERLVAGAAAGVSIDCMADFLRAADALLGGTSG